MFEAMIDKPRGRNTLMVLHLIPWLPPAVYITKTSLLAFPEAAPPMFIPSTKNVSRPHLLKNWRMWAIFMRRNFVSGIFGNFKPAPMDFPEEKTVEDAEQHRIGRKIDRIPTIFHRFFMVKGRHGFSASDFSHQSSENNFPNCWALSEDT